MRHHRCRSSGSCLPEVSTGFHGRRTHEHHQHPGHLGHTTSARSHLVHTAPPRRGSIRASGSLWGWRTVDLLTVTFLGAAFGVAYWAWGLAYTAPADGLEAIFPPLQGITGAPWLMAGVVGGLVIRRPGSALLCEVVAALVSMLPGTKWGATTLVSGILQGLGAEIAFLLLGYAVFGIGAALLAGALCRAARGALRVAGLLDRLGHGLQARLRRHPHRRGPSWPAASAGC